MYNLGVEKQHWKVGVWKEVMMTMNQWEQWCEAWRSGRPVCGAAADNTTPIIVSRQVWQRDAGV